MHRPRGRVLSTRDHASRADGRQRAAILPLCDAPAVAVTSKDIARRLNISQSTVSRALREAPPRGRGDDGADPRGGGADALHAESGRAQPDHGRTGTIGVIVADITNPFYPELRGPPQRVRARRLPHRARQRAHRCAARAAVADLVRRRGRRAVLVSATLGYAGCPRGTARHPRRPPQSVRRGRSGRHGRLRQPSAAARSPRRLSTWGTAARAHRRTGERVDEPRPRAAASARAHPRGVALDDTLRRGGQYCHHSGYQWARPARRHPRPSRSSAPTTSSPSA